MMVKKIQMVSFAVVLPFILFVSICTISLLPLSHAIEDDLAAANECPQDDSASKECKAVNEAAAENDYFYAWDTSAHMPLVNALFPDLSKLAAAWERYPLLSRVSEKQNLEAQGGQIPTFLHNRSLVSTLKQLDNENNYKNGDPILSLMSVDDTLSVLSQPSMKHGSDYKLVKKIIREGEEYVSHIYLFIQ